MAKKILVTKEFHQDALQWMEERKEIVDYVNGLRTYVACHFDTEQRSHFDKFLDELNSEED